MTTRLSRNRGLGLLYYGWPIIALLGILWFPFDWLSTVWPPFGDLFRQVFRNDHDHFVGHTIFFLIVGGLILLYVPVLLSKLHWYLAGLIVAALIQETIQAIFGGRALAFTDINAFKGDALGGISAFVLWRVIVWLRQHWRDRVGIAT